MGGATATTSGRPTAGTTWPSWPRPTRSLTPAASPRLSVSRLSASRRSGSGPTGPPLLADRRGKLRAMIDLDLSGRRAIVTGASLGIGAAVVRLLADHGATVSFCARGDAAVADLAGYRPAGPGPAE